MTLYEISLNHVVTTVTVEADSVDEAKYEAQEELEELHYVDRHPDNMTVRELPAADETPA